MRLPLPMPARDSPNRPVHRRASETAYGARSKGIGFPYPAMMRTGWIGSFADRGSWSPRLVTLAADRPPNAQTGTCKSCNNPGYLRERLHGGYATEQQGHGTADHQCDRNARMCGQDQCNLKGDNRHRQQINREPTDQFVRHVFINGDSIQLAQPRPKQAMNVERLTRNANLAVE